MADSIHPLATHHLPMFITAPGETDVFLGVLAFILLGVVLAAGVFFFWLHSLPERMVHNKVQFDIVVVLALLSLFTHIHAFWVAALLIALIKFPEFTFSSSLDRMASSLEKLAGIEAKTAEPAPSASDHVPDKAA
jgi:cation transport ATPase